MGSLAVLLTSFKGLAWPGEGILESPAGLSTAEGPQRHFSGLLPGDSSTVADTEICLAVLVCEKGESWMETSVLEDVEGAKGGR